MFSGAGQGLSRRSSSCSPGATSVRDEGDVSCHRPPGWRNQDLEIHWTHDRQRTFFIMKNPLSDNYLCLKVLMAGNCYKRGGYKSCEFFGPTSVNCGQFSDEDVWLH